MRNRLLSVAIGCFFSLFAIAADLATQNPLKEGHPDKYIVIKGDTLWGISEKFLDSPWLWPEIWQVNPQIANPHLIFPGDTIGLVYVDGRAKLTVLRRGAQGRTVKLTPTARITPIDTAIPSIPMDAVDSFIVNNRIVEEELLLKAPYIISGEEGQLIGGKDDRVYARGLFDNTPQKRYGIYRGGDQYVDPVTNELLGYEALEIGSAKVTAQNNDVLTMILTDTNQDVRIGDRLLEAEEVKLETVFHPSSPEQEIRGHIIAVPGGVSQIGQFDVVVINKGEREKVKPGNVMAIYRKGALVKDPIAKETVELPAERAGLLMVFRVFDKVSYGLVLRSKRVLSVLDEVRNP